MIHKVTFNIQTKANGAYNSITDGGVLGQIGALGPMLLYAVEWVDDDLENGVDAVLSCTGESGVTKTLLTLTDANNDATYYPRTAEHGNGGGEIDFFTLPLVEGILSLAVTDGGDTKSGKCILSLLEV